MRGALRIYCLKRGKLAGLGYNYPPNPASIFSYRSLLDTAHPHKDNRRAHPPRLSERDGGQVEEAEIPNSPGEVQCGEGEHWP